MSQSDTRKVKEPPDQFTGIYTRCYHQETETERMGQLGRRQGIIIGSVSFEWASTTTSPASG